MTAQLAFELSPLAEVTYEAEASLPEQYAAWAAVNGHVIDAMEALAEHWFAAGNTRVSMRQLWERLRWESGMQSVDGGPYALNNNWPPFIARELIGRHPSWAEHIATRRSLADST